MKSRPMNILLLEDNDNDASLILHELKKAGIAYTAKTATTKDAFLKALKEFKPDAILADYSLPHFTGLEAFVLARAQGLILPFLLVTGAIPEATVIEIIKAGIDDYILKDDLQRLPNALKNAYEKCAAERRNHELNELRQKFIQIMAHQLRTPLTVVSWQLTSLLDGEAGKLSAEQQEKATLALDSNKKLTARIDDLLTVVNIEEGKTTFGKEHVSLEALWKPILETLKKDCKAKSITCTYTAPEKALPKLTVDPEKLTRVFKKLAENAVAYTSKHEKISAQLIRTDAGVRFVLDDTGIGIPEADQPKIFTAFFRADNASTALPDASGVGLAISKYFVEQHGGTIGFTSKQGQGSSFWFELPIHHH